jgi:ammonium transporter Rh
MGVFEVFAYAFNEHIVVTYLGVIDTGGSTYIHTFGAYYGLALGYFLRPTKRDGKELVSHAHIVSSRLSKLMAFTGAIFLWMYWPSFNSVTTHLINGHDRAIVCTVLSLTASTLISGVTSYYLRGGKFHTDDFINASLAGGAIVGANAEIIIDPFSSILLGAIGGLISTYGYARLDPWLMK